MTMNRFLRSIRFIEDNIDNDISVHDVASAAFYSTFHFSRMFKALTGESIKDYISKRRLTIAAQRLMNEDVSLIELALTSRFSSQEAFSRAFKRMFGISPGKYRFHDSPLSIKYRHQVDQDTLHYLEEKITRQPRIIEKPSALYVGIDKKFHENESDYLTLWKPFKTYMGKIPNQIPNAYFGIYDAFEESNNDVYFTYMCCAQVNSLKDIPTGLVGKKIDQQLYAVFTHKGSLMTLKETFKYIWGTWLPNSNYDYHPTPDFELFPENYDASSPDSSVELYIPIKARNS